MTPESTLEVRRFAAEDFPTYRAWYADARLNRHLGPMDEEWLAHVLADTEEDHIYWLEKQLGLIEKVGLQNYLQSQM